MPYVLNVLESTVHMVLNRCDWYRRMEYVEQLNWLIREMKEKGGMKENALLQTKKTKLVMPHTCGSLILTPNQVGVHKYSTHCSRVTVHLGRHMIYGRQVPKMYMLCICICMYSTSDIYFHRRHFFLKRCLSHTMRASTWVGVEYHKTAPCVAYMTGIYCLL